MAGKQFGTFSKQGGVSGGRKACGDEGRDWVKVVGKGAIPGPLPVGPLCAGPGAKHFTRVRQLIFMATPCRAPSPASSFFPYCYSHLTGEKTEAQRD